jgi:hypothetical protein
MRACARVIAAVFALGFILFTVLALVLWNTDSYLLDSDAYKQALASVQIYDRLPQLLGGQIQFSLTYDPCAQDPASCEGEPPAPGDRTEQGGPPSYFQELDAAEWEAFFQAVFPAGWMEAQAESVIDQVFDSLRASDPQPVSLSLIGLKTHLRGPDGARAARVLIEAQPACTDAQLLDLVQGVREEGEIDSLLVCRPPDEILEANMEIVRAEFHQMVDEWPNTTDLSFGFLRGEPSDGPSTRAPEHSGWLDALALFRWVARLSPLAPVVCLLLLTLFAVRSKVQACRWWGIPFLLAGLLAAAGAAAANPLLRWAVDSLLLPRAPQSISPDLIGLAIELVFEVSRGLATRVLIQSLVLVLLGIGLLVLARMLRPQRPEAPRA